MVAGRGGPIVITQLKFQGHVQVITPVILPPKGIKVIASALFTKKSLFKMLDINKKLPEIVLSDS
jgi:hypothetical protein